MQKTLMIIFTDAVYLLIKAQHSKNKTFGMAMMDCETAAGKTVLCNLQLEVLMNKVSVYITDTCS